MILLRTALRRILSQEWLEVICVRARSDAEMGEAAEQIRCLLRECHLLDRRDADDDFEIHSQAELIAAHQEIGDTSEVDTCCSATAAGYHSFVRPRRKRTALPARGEP